jgi:fumarate reductase flavoprotein subunit
MAKILTRRANDLGVQFLMKTLAQKILKRGGRIIGVIAKNEAGDEIRIEAKAAIVATGGFAGNKEWVKKYTGYDEGQNLVSLSKMGKGDGIRMAWEVGAAASPMMIGLTHTLPPPCNGGGGTSMEFNAFAKSENIMVNLLGERFLNDDLRGSQGEAGAHGTVASCIALQKGKAGFMIFDGALKKYYASQPSPFAGMPRQYQPTFKHEDLDDNIRELLATGYKYIFMADSLEELCAQTGISYGGLKKTLAEYNKFCEQGRDDRFYKNPEYLKPITGPKYYAGKFIAGAYGTSGGIRTNCKMEVLTERYDVIPGLYAAGNDANNMYDHSYTILSGNHIGFAVNSGRIAAESALEYIKALA